MLTDVDLPAHLRPLLHLDADEALPLGPDSWPDYVADLSLTSADVPALLAVVDQWFQWHRGDEPFPEHPRWCDPIHAWRAIAQLRAVDAIEPLLANADMLDDATDDWSHEDWPYLFAVIGPAAIPPLSQYAADEAHREFARAMAVNSLRQIAARESQCRDEVVKLLSGQLARHEPQPVVNGSLVGALVDLQAVEAAEIIERAFAAEVVGEEMVGDWGDIRAELGVEGLGIAPLRPRTRRIDAPTPWMYDSDRWRDPADRAHQRQQAKRDKAKRKASAKSRKRNRRVK